MTDKRTIIDGVNVRECACIIEDYYYQQANNLANGYKHIKNVCELGESGSEYYKLFCKDNPKCYYKQLKRKEQKLEKIKDICNTYQMEYMVNNGVNLLTTKILQILKENKMSECKKYCEGLDCSVCDETEPCIYRIANKLQEQLKRKERECECERWKPELNEEYYYVSEDGKTVQTRNCGWEPATNRVKFYNCFKSEKQAEAEAEKILVRRQLEDIARRLNKGQKIDWSDEDQAKSFIFLDYKTQLIERDCNLRNKIQGVVYCLDDSFRKIAIQEIGEERLKKYLKGEQ